MIKLFNPSLGNEELEALREIFEEGWIGLGPKTEEFEEKFADYIGAKYAVGLNSATAALDLSLKLLNINYGDQVIVPTITFVSTAHVVAYNLATPIFVDVDENLSIDVEDLKRKITPRTKAIMVVHYSGRPVDMDRVKEVAGDIPIIEDAAHAVGSLYKGTKCGNLGNLACFSFHAVKNLTMGDGGAITTDNKEFYERAKRLRWLGIDKGTWERTQDNKTYWWEYDVTEIGLKCHMNDISAVIGLCQLEKIDLMNRIRKRIAGIYDEGLKGVKQIKTPIGDTRNFKSSWHIYCIKCEQRDDLSYYLKEKGIATGVHHKPIHLYKCYNNIPSLPEAEKQFKKILSLPMHIRLSIKDVHTIISEIKNFYGG